MVLWAIALMSAMLGFGAGILVRMPDRRGARQFKALIEHLKWLPVVSVFNDKRVGKTYPTVEFEGGLRLVSFGNDGAWIEYNKIGIGVPNPDMNWGTLSLTDSQRAKLTAVMRERALEHAMDHATAGLLTEKAG